MMIEIWSYSRDKKPTCHLCRKVFRREGDRWVGNCAHFRGKSVGW